MVTSRSLLIGLGVIGAGSIGFGVASRFSPTKPLAHVQGRVPVLVELFTSEGCSSCPPADKLLMELQKNQPEDNALVIPLGEHVTYWNGASWRDRFSMDQFDARQMSYVQSLHVGDGPYTPQMVVDGRSEFVGSDDASAAKAISSAASQPKAPVDIKVKPMAGGDVAVTISASPLPNESGRDPEDVYLAVTENNLASQVKGGENGGRRLNHTAVVRKLVRVGTGLPYRGETSVKLEPSWSRDNLSIVGFIQRRQSRRIVGAGLAGL